MSQQPYFDCILKIENTNRESKFETQKIPAIDDKIILNDDELHRVRKVSYREVDNGMGQTPNLVCVIEVYPWEA